MSDIGKTKLNFVLLWAILGAIVTGIYQAGQIRAQISSVAEEVKRVRGLEERMLKVETLLGMYSHPATEKK